MNNFRGLLVGVIALAAIAGFMLGGASFHAPVIGSEPTAASVDNDSGSTRRTSDNDDSIAWSHGDGYSGAATDEHWRKRRSEFSGDHDGREYEGHRDSTSWSHGRNGSEANADEHWRKHGSEFSEDHNAREYGDEAFDFVHNPPSGAEIKHRANGDTLIYDRNTNTFAVEDRHGNPRTMFKPDRGEGYWERQR